MFSKASFDLSVLYLVLFVGYFVTFITVSQYIGYAIMLLSLMGIYVVQIGLTTNESMNKSFITMSIAMFGVSSTCTLLTIYLIMLNSISNMSSGNHFNALSYIIQIILFFQIVILLCLNYFKKTAFKAILNLVEVLLAIINLYLVYNLRSMNASFTSDDCKLPCNS